MWRKLHETMSFDEMYDRTVYLHDSLGLAGEDGDKAVAALVADLAPQITAWLKLAASRREAVRGVGRANSLLKRRGLQVDGVVRDLNAAALAEVKQDRKHPVFVRLFPTPLHLMVRLALARQMLELRRFQINLGEAEIPASLRKEHAKPIADAIARGDAAIRGRQEAVQAFGQTVVQVGAWRDETNRVAKGVEGRLLQIASDRKLDKEWVTSFFMAPDKRPPAAKPKPNTPQSPASSTAQPTTPKPASAAKAG